MSLGCLPLQLICWFINHLIKRLRYLNVGAHIQDLYTGSFFHADDIALVAINNHCLQIMMNECYKFACQWRFILHPGKSKILVFGESKATSNRKWFLGNSNVSEVTSHTHCGVLLNTDRSNIHVTKTLCRKGRGIMLSIMNSGFCNANPITNCKLYKSVVLPSTLFGLNYGQM